MASHRITLPFVVLLLCLGCKPDRSSDTEDVQKAMAAYRDAWRQGDKDAVLSYVSDDIVLHMPTLSGKPVSGKPDVAAFWFPASDVSYPITAYEVVDESITVEGNMAFYSGISRLSWHTLRGDVRSDSASATSEFLNVLRREQGSWKLVRIMYNLKDAGYPSVNP